MQEKLKQIRVDALAEIDRVADLQSLQSVRIKYLGKKGPITEVLRGMGSLSPEGRPLIGKLVNEIREEIEQVLRQKEEFLQEKEMEQRLKEETIDVTLPGKPSIQGNRHPLTRIIEEIENIFSGMGFEVAEGPEVESDYYNFEALNLPKDHPARDMQDTFYITDDILMRTHTSPVQVRTMLEKKGEVPVKIICPGKVYRRDDDDATHSHQFTQIEGLVVDENISMGDLKGVLLSFAKRMFGEHSKIRLRPSFFPFTEPSAEVDVSCMICHGEGCRVCKETGWIEILGAGMVHPKVLENAGYDPNKYTGFAFGMGVERIAMLKYGIDDIRQFYTNDLRLLNQFKRM
ncbi:phenylalanine--tRNA ligase subunit alpha [Tepidibacillus fermentans]|uniref:Phenylalanine--tRNA ligase alpha subunit n=1 Tax=Tepidibacillus fermentans TaxID=1281767 RepID=A0A4R3KJ82_9BACI|nr:phenylalanine--tRNA ligase subunit alpha [Tepidibacillus fermentans]TCS83519.1 phenylalanyl-tRNA synthetase alpha subunit [Tepidibacillus fermentans]